MSSNTSNRTGTIRPNQIITTFGPGSIYDVMDDSVMIMGVDFWGENFTPIVDERLLGHLKKIGNFRNVVNFRIPSSSGQKQNLTCITFPVWGECPRCNKLVRREGNPLRRKLNCPDCGPKSGTDTSMTHPARLIMACKNGHIDDFPWFQWPKHNRDDCDDTKLYLRKNVQTVSLAGLEVQCDNCGGKRNLGGALSKAGLVFMGRCPGRRPWLKDRESCEDIPRGLLRGASNVYFSSTVRALFIPPFTDRLNEHLKQYFSVIQLYRNNESKLLEFVKDALPGYDPQVVLKSIQHRFSTIEGTLETNIEKDEWLMLNSKNEYDHDEFRTEYQSPPYGLENVIENLILVKRLKETVVLKGFTRIDPPDPEDPRPRKLASISTEVPLWLPAVENHGEGIFFSIPEESLRNWENEPSVRKRTDTILAEHNNIRKLRYQGKGLDFPPRFIFLHTLSHLLIRELSVYAGYSSASIRERIYGNEGMAGILLYTSSASSDGSLGGLVELGKTKFKLILDRARNKSRFCSSDPLCAMHDPTTSHRDNGAACHACSFLPETSCINMNVLLDRSMVDSTIAENTVGFFSHVKSR